MGVIPGKVVEMGAFGAQDVRAVGRLGHRRREGGALPRRAGLRDSPGYFRKKKVPGESSGRVSRPAVTKLLWAETECKGGGAP